MNRSILRSRRLIYIYLNRFNIDHDNNETAFPIVEQMEEGESCSNSNDQSARIENWSKEEKYQLLQALKKVNFNDLEQLKQNVPNKSKDEIRNAIEYYKIKLMEHPTLSKKIMKEKKLNSNNIIPLVDWAKFLTDSLSFEDLHTETATALRMIAELEEFPSPVCLNNIDFKLIYHTLANALEGKTLSKDKYIIAFLEKCLVDTALTSKAFIRQSTYKTIIKSVNMSDRAVNSFPRPTDNQELANIRHLASQRTYNPLNISEEYLKSNQ